jgi:hypothetical protein
MLPWIQILWRYGKSFFATAILSVVKIDVEMDINIYILVEVKYRITQVTTHIQPFGERLLNINTYIH